MQLTNERGNPVWLTYADFLAERPSASAPNGTWGSTGAARSGYRPSTGSRGSTPRASCNAVALEDGYDGAVELLAVVLTEEDVREPR